MSKPKTSEMCVECGQVHDDNPFTSEVIDLYEKAQAAEDEEERIDLLSELAKAVMDGTKDGDIDVPETLHTVIQEATEAHLRYHSALMRVGRSVVRNLKAIQVDKAMWDHLKDHLAGRPSKAGVVIAGSPAATPFEALTDPKGAKKAN